MPDPHLVKKIYKLHVALFRELNDIHIFSAHTIPLLAKTAENYGAIKSKADKAFLVPSRRGKKGIARRTHKEVATLFNRFATRDLHSNLLIACVSRLESLLNDVLRTFLAKYPEKLSIGPKGGDSSKNIPISLVIEADDLDDVLGSITNTRLQSVFYAEPKEYLSYFEAITSVKLPEESFLAFVEVKATRDLIIHNNGLANDLYLRKAGKLARAKLGDPVIVDEAYFARAISTMKDISAQTDKQVRASYT